MVCTEIKVLSLLAAVCVTVQRPSGHIILTSWERFSKKCPDHLLYLKHLAIRCPGFYFTSGHMLRATLSARLQTIPHKLGNIAVQCGKVRYDCNAPFKVV